MGYAMKGSPRWKRAAIDADVNVENIARIFSPVVGVKINKSDTPEIWYMLQNLLKMGDTTPPQQQKNIICARVLSLFLSTEPVVLKTRMGILAKRC